MDHPLLDNGFCLRGKLHIIFVFLGHSFIMLFRNNSQCDLQTFGENVVVTNDLI